MYAGNLASWYCWPRCDLCVSTGKHIPASDSQFFLGLSKHVYAWGKGGTSAVLRDVQQVKQRSDQTQRCLGRPKRLQHKRSMSVVF